MFNDFFGIPSNYSRSNPFFPSDEEILRERQKKLELKRRAMEQRKLEEQRQQRLKKLREQELLRKKEEELQRRQMEEEEEEEEEQSQSESEESHETENPDQAAHHVQEETEKKEEETQVKAEKIHNQQLPPAAILPKFTEEQAAIIIQKIWRGKLTRKLPLIPSLRELQQIKKKVKMIEFKYSSSLQQLKEDFTKLEIQTLKQLLHKILSYEEEFTKLLLSLDSIPSGGSVLIRDERKQIVTFINAKLKDIEPGKNFLKATLEAIQSQRKEPHHKL